MSHQPAEALSPELAIEPRYAPFTFSRLEAPWKHFHVPTDAPFEVDKTLLPALCRVDRALRRKFPYETKARLRREIGSALSATVSDDMIEGIGIEMKMDPIVLLYRELGIPHRTPVHVKRAGFGMVSATARRQLRALIDDAMISADETDYVIAEGVMVLLEEVVRRSCRRFHEVYLEAVAWIKKLAKEWSAYPFSSHKSNFSLIHKLMDRDPETVTWTLFTLESPAEAFSDSRAHLSGPQRTAAIYETLERHYGITTVTARHELHLLQSPYEGLTEENVKTHKILHGEDPRSQYPGWDGVRGWVPEEDSNEEDI